MDRGYVDFERLFTLHRTGRFFVIRAKSNTEYRRRYSHPRDESGGVRCDQTIVLSGVILLLYHFFIKELCITR